VTYEKWKAYYDLAGKHPVVADLEHNVLFALGDWIDDHNVLTTRLEAAKATWEAQALEAGVRIAELEAQVRELQDALATLSGCLGRIFWDIAADKIWDAMRKVRADAEEKPQEGKGA